MYAEYVPKPIYGAWVKGIFWNENIHTVLWPTFLRTRVPVDLLNVENRTDAFANSLFRLKVNNTGLFYYCRKH